MLSSKNCGFVDSHHVHVRGHEQNVLWRLDRGGADGVRVVRDDLFFGVAHVDAGFEYLDPLVGELRPFEAAYQLFGLTREHRAADNFNPALAAGVFQKHSVVMSIAEWSSFGGRSASRHADSRAGSFRGTGIRRKTGSQALFEPFDPGSEGVQSSVYVLVSAVDLVDVLDRRDPFGRHGGDQ